MYHLISLLAISLLFYSSIVLWENLFLSLTILFLRIERKIKGIVSKRKITFFNTGKDGISSESFKGKRLLTPAEVRDILNISLSHVYNLLRDDIIPNVRIGKSIRVDQSDLDEYIEENKSSSRREIVELIKALG